MSTASLSDVLQGVQPQEEIQDTYITSDQSKGGSEQIDFSQLGEVPEDKALTKIEPMYYPSEEREIIPQQPELQTNKKRQKQIDAVDDGLESKMEHVYIKGPDGKDHLFSIQKGFTDDDIDDIYRDAFGQEPQGATPQDMEILNSIDPEYKTKKQIYLEKARYIAGEGVSLGLSIAVPTALAGLLAPISAPVGATIGATAMLLRATKFFSNKYVRWGLKALGNVSMNAVGDFAGRISGDVVAGRDQSLSEAFERAKKDAVYGAYFSGAFEVGAVGLKYTKEGIEKTTEGIKLRKKSERIKQQRGIDIKEAKVRKAKTQERINDTNKEIDRISKELDEGTKAHIEKETAEIARKHEVAQKTAFEEGEKVLGKLHNEGKSLFNVLARQITEATHRAKVYISDQYDKFYEDFGHIAIETPENIVNALNKYSEDKFEGLKDQINNFNKLFDEGKNITIGDTHALQKRLTSMINDLAKASTPNQEKMDALRRLRSIVDDQIAGKVGTELETAGLRLRQINRLYSENAELQKLHKLFSPDLLKKASKYASEEIPFEQQRLYGEAVGIVVNKLRKLESDLLSGKTKLKRNKKGDLVPYITRDSGKIVGSVSDNLTGLFGQIAILKSTGDPALITVANKMIDNILKFSGNLASEGNTYKILADSKIMPEVDAKELARKIEELRRNDPKLKPMYDRLDELKVDLGKLEKRKERYEKFKTKKIGEQAIDEQELLSKSDPEAYKELQLGISRDIVYPFVMIYGIRDFFGKALGKIAETGMFLYAVAQSYPGLAKHVEPWIEKARNQLDKNSKGARLVSEFLEMGTIEYDQN